MDREWCLILGQCLLEMCMDPSVALEKLRCDLLSLNRPCGLLNIIIPSLTKINHDHSYHKPSENADGHLLSLSAANSNSNNSNNSSCNLSVLKERMITEEELLESFHLTSEERLLLEKDTRSQSSCSEWYEVRRVRITGSKCGRIIMQNKKTVALLHFCVYPKPMIFLPKAIFWGKENEHNTRKAHVEHQKNNGHINLTASDSGFIVHFEKCWLGASPDAWVCDPSVILIQKE